MHRLLFMMLALSFCSSCSEVTSKPDTLIQGGFDEKEMDAAVARARREVDSFIAELSHPTGEDHAVKVPIADGEAVEHFWLVDVTYQNGEFSGRINNEPGMVSNVQMGDRRQVAKAEMSDWLFMRDGKMHGNYTLRPLLKTMPEKDVKIYEAMLADP
jgi:uncharacterized protein YegJ (DUF2314 family)